MKSSLQAREILDSRGNPTVEVEIRTSKGTIYAQVPAGASKGKYEAKELRDNTKRFLGLGVSKAVKNAEILGKKLEFKHYDEREKILGNKINKVGANATLALSVAFLKRDALIKQIPLYEHIGNIYHNKKFILPIPSMNVINGGKHAGNDLDFQEFMLYPDGAKSFSEALRIGSETYHVLREIILKKYGKNAVNIGDEGGFAPPLKKTEEALELLDDAIRKAGYKNKIKIAVDAAASEFYKNKMYYCDGKLYDSMDFVDRHKELAKKYPIVSIEDPFDQDDFEAFYALTKELKKIQIVGDDLLVTNKERITIGLIDELCNALLLKINQIGTMKEALFSAKLAQDNKWNVMVSHRSGDTTDDFIADLAVGVGAGQIKSGAPVRGERIAKYNRLLRIEEELGKKAKYGI